MKVPSPGWAAQTRVRWSPAQHLGLRIEHGVDLAVAAGHHRRHLVATAHLRRECEQVAFVLDWQQGAAAGQQGRRRPRQGKAAKSKTSCRESPVGEPSSRPA
jgi:hypothetical protein